MFQTFSSLSVRSAALRANSGSSLSTFFRFCTVNTACRWMLQDHVLAEHHGEGHHHSNPQKTFSSSCCGAGLCMLHNNTSTCSGPGSRPQQEFMPEARSLTASRQ